MAENNCTLSCEACPWIKQPRISFRGDIKSELVIVGESPGAMEAIKGMPFMGPNGEILATLIPEKYDPLVTCAVNCLMTKKEPEVLAQAVQHCRKRLISEITAHPRKVILALGTGALWALTGNYDLKITQSRGQVFETEFGTVVAALHPAYVMRGAGSFPKFKGDVQLALDILEGRYIRPYKHSKHIVCETDDEIEELVKIVKQQPLVASDIETSGLDPLKSYILSVGFCFQDDLSYIVPGEKADQVKELYEDPNVRWIWHNGKFDVGHLIEAGIEARVDEDTILLNYALDETRGVHDLDQVASDVLRAPTHKHMVAQYIKKKTGQTDEDVSYANIPRHILYEYHGLDLAKTFQIFKVLRQQVAADPALEKLYTKTLIPASKLLTSIERRGFAFDEVAWADNKLRLEAEKEKYRQEISAIVGWDINPGSPKQVCTAAYDQLKIPCRQRSTDKKIVDKWPNSPFKKALQKWRKVSKALSTYVVGLREQISDDNAAHSTYLLHGTRTGRLASRKPNMQNIPRDPLLKRQFTARKGYILIDGDASQAELRSLAMQSGDEELCAIFNDTDRSLHKEVAKTLYGPDYTDDEYVRAKAVNFGIAYGREAFSLAEEFDISVKEAQKMIDGWFARFPKAKAYIDKCRNAPVKRQTIVNIFGRKCRPGMVTRENLKDVQNEFANFPHQSTASDITLHVAMWIFPKLESIGAGIVNLVHDSIVIECPDETEKVKQVQEWVHEGFALIPKQWGLNKVPFKSDCKLEYMWGNPIKEEEWLNAKRA